MEVRERILQKAELMFFRYGVKTVTMDDIARELGISKKTIYQHFPEKDELVYQVINLEMQKDKCEYEELGMAALNVIERMIQASRLMYQTLVTINPRLLYEVQKYFPRAWASFQGHMRDFALNSMKKDLQQGINEGLIRADLDVEIAARMRLKQIETGFDNQLFPPETFNLVQVQLEMLNLFTRGIVTPAGQQLYETLYEELSHQLKIPNK